MGSWILSILAGVGSLFVGILSLHLRSQVKFMARTKKELETDWITSHTQYHLTRGKVLRVVFSNHRWGSRVPLLVLIHGSGGQVQKQRRFSFDMQRAILYSSVL